MSLRKLESLIPCDIKPQDEPKLLKPQNQFKPVKSCIPELVRDFNNFKRHAKPKPVANKPIPAKFLKITSKKKFIKYDPAIHEALGSATCALLLQELEYRFKKYPDGFYKFLAPCKSSFYRKGDSLSEALNLCPRQIRRISNVFIKKYDSKTLYMKAVEELGEEASFHGMPYLLYRDHHSRQTFFKRNAKVVDQILAGNPLKMSPVVIGKMSPVTPDNMSPVTPDNMSPVGALKPAETKAEISPTVNTYTKNTLFLNTSQELPPPKCAEIEQPKEEKLINDISNTKQPLNAVSDLTVTEMIKVWRKVTGKDLESSISKKTIANLKLEYTYTFESSMKKWIEYVELIASSKFLMGETKENYAVKLAVICTKDFINKVQNEHFTTGDRKVMIYLEINPINDSDPEVLKFKQTCLAKMEKGRYKSWVEPLGIRRNSSGEMVCMTPNAWFARHISQNDMLGFSYFIKSLGIPAVVIMSPLSTTPVATIKPINDR